MTQQQQKPGVLPSLADLDKPPVQQNSAATAAIPEPVVPQQNQDPISQQRQQGNEDPNNPGVKPGEPVEKEPVEVNEEGMIEDVEGDIDPVSVYNEVSRLRGDGFEFKFPNDVDPATPVGIHTAIQQVVEHELDNFERELQKGDARAYSYMLHRANGGSDEEFFAQKTEVLPEWETLKNSVDLQQAFYKRSLVRRGILPDQADLIIKDAIQKNQLPGLVESDYKETQRVQEKQLEELMEANKRQSERENQLISQMGASIRQRILENKDLNITIPDAKRTEFLQFFTDKVELDRETGRWYIRQELSKDNMTSLIEAMYYQSVKGNLDDIITKKASQKNVQRLKLKMAAEKQKVQTSTDPTVQTNVKPGVRPALSEL